MVKAEIEIKPRVWASPEIAYPSTISVYYTNKINEIKGVAYNSTNNPITGKYVKTENNEEDRYIFDITDLLPNNFPVFPTPRMSDSCY